MSTPACFEWSLSFRFPHPNLYNFSSFAYVDCVWNVMTHAQKPDFVFRRNGRVHLNRRGRQFSRLLAADVCASVVVMLDTPCSEVVWRVLATRSIRQFPLHFPSRASPCAITFQLESALWPSHVFLFDLKPQHVERSSNHEAPNYVIFVSFNFLPLRPRYLPEQPIHGLFSSLNTTDQDWSLI